MLVVIAILLAIIVAIMAPWLAAIIGTVAAAGALVYYAVIAIVAAVMFSVLVVTAFRGPLKKFMGRRKLEAKIAEANRMFREKEAASGR